jgi:6-phosphogluconate dehydrogenase
MEIGFIGLGRMGEVMATRLADKGHRVVTYDVSPKVVASVVERGLEGAKNLKQLAKALKPPRIIWLMIPAGKAVDDVIFEGLMPYLIADDLLVDGGNSNYKDTIRRGQKLIETGIGFMDVGTSGGIKGVHNGLSLMAGGSQQNYRRLEKLLKDLAMENGYGLMGDVGAGHFVKMVHNGIEYALLQSYAEGFEMLKEGPFEIDLSLVARIWNKGSVIRSWLLELTQEVLESDGLIDVEAEVGGGQTGRWAVEAALENEVPFTMLSAALSERYRSRRRSFAAQLVAALRREFGGHSIKKK